MVSVNTLEENSIRDEETALNRNRPEAIQHRIPSNSLPAPENTDLPPESGHEHQWLTQECSLRLDHCEYLPQLYTDREHIHIWVSGAFTIVRLRLYNRSILASSRKYAVLDELYEGSSFALRALPKTDLSSTVF